MNFKARFEKTAVLGALSGLGIRALGKGLSAAGRKAVALGGGGVMGALNLAGTGAQAVGDYGDFGKKMRQAQMR